MSPNTNAGRSPLGDSANQESAAFYSDGLQLAADVFRPITSAPKDGYPAVVACHGFGGIKEFYVGDIARALAAQGFLALTFDYRGYGESEGTRNRLFPMEQVADTVAAASYLRTREDVDQSRIGAYGTSFGGGIAIAAAAKAAHIRAVVCAVGIGDCGRWLRSLRPHWEWLEFLKRLDNDRLERTRTGGSEVVEPEEIMPRDPESLENEAGLREKYPKRAFKLTLASGEAIRDFRPVDFLARLASQGVMYIGVEEDGLAPFDQTLELFEASSEPKQLLALTGLTHHQIYEPQHLFGVMESVGSFFREQLEVE